LAPRKKWRERERREKVRKREEKKLVCPTLIAHAVSMRKRERERERERWSASKFFHEQLYATKMRELDLSSKTEKSTYFLGKNISATFIRAKIVLEKLKINCFFNF